MRRPCMSFSAQAGLPDAGGQKDKAVAQGWGRGSKATAQ